MYRRGRRWAACHVVSVLAGVFALATTAEARPGDVIVGDSSLHTVFRLKPATGHKSVISDDAKLVSPNDSVFGPSGALYVADYDAFGGLGGVLKINPRSGRTTKLAGGAPFSQPDGIALGPSGDLFETDLVSDALFRVGIPGGGVHLASSVADGPLGVVVPPNGKPIVGTSVPSIVRINPRTGAQHVLASAADGITQGGGLARAPDGTLYTAASVGIDSVDPRTGEVQHVSSAPADGYGLAIDFHGNVVSRQVTMSS
jgi:hypothetical protein